MSTNRARRVIDQICGHSYEETPMILELMPCGACDPILKLVNSAVTKASNNMDLKETSLLVSKAEVKERPTRKKIRPQA
ncbi:50s ribosomal protein l22 [Quercus suber]|uniref:50s ribosomal protein l22 n=1 Tax=Quercus suber TaxID=58331 RepID=A0AAW0KUW5_QUESU